MTSLVTDNAQQLSEEQNALLELLLSNEAADQDTSMYGYADMPSEANSFQSYPDFNFADIFPFTGLLNDPQDLAQSAVTTAYLESLANFEHPVQLELAASDALLGVTATADEQTTTQPERQDDHTRNENERSVIDDEFFTRSFAQDSQSSRRQRFETKGKLVENLDERESRNKQRKVTFRSLSEEDLALERELWGSEDEEDGFHNDPRTPEHSPLLTSEARTAGVHSATALFRRPSKASRKYSRPAMSKLFTSLELDPESFLHLQAAAKSYMLDEAHPERTQCVGSKTRGDSDIIKLKLYGTVRAFLHDEGWGDKYFSEGTSIRKFTWPKHETKIIALVTPLLRRMVTNERQRQYALGARTKKQKEGYTLGISRSRDVSATPTESTLPPTMQPKPLMPYSPRPDQPCDGTIEINSISVNKQNKSASIRQQEDSIDENVKYRVNITQNGRRMIPQITLTSVTCPGFSSLIRHIYSLVEDNEQRLKSIEVLGPDGLVGVKDENAWRDTLASIEKNDWMDGEVKCVVEIEAKA